MTAEEILKESLPLHGAEWLKMLQPEVYEGVLKAMEEYRTQHQELPKRVKCTCANGLEYSNCDKNCERLDDEQSEKPTARTSNELPGDEEIETYVKGQPVEKISNDYRRNLITHGARWMRSLASPAIASRDARIRELEEENKRLDSQDNYKQIAFKLQDDIEMKSWESAQKNIPFLKEMKVRLNKYQNDKDVTQIEMVHKMIDDWINELESIK